MRLNPFLPILIKKSLYWRLAQNYINVVNNTLLVHYLTILPFSFIIAQIFLFLHLLLQPLLYVSIVLLIFIILFLPFMSIKLFYPFLLIFANFVHLFALSSFYPSPFSLNPFIPLVFTPLCKNEKPWFDMNLKPCFVIKGNPFFQL